MLTVPFFVTAFDYSLNKYALKFSLRKGGCWTFSPSSFFQVDCQLPKRGALSLNSPFSPPGHITGAQEEFVQKKEKRKVRKNLLIKKKKILKKRDHRTRRLIENISRCSRTQWIATSFRSRQSGFFAGRLTLDAGTASQAERASGPGTGSAGLGLWDSCGGKSLLLLWIVTAQKFLRLGFQCPCRKRSSLPPMPNIPGMRRLPMLAGFLLPPPGCTLCTTGFLEHPEQCVL